MGIRFNSLSRSLDASTPSPTFPRTPFVPRGFRDLTICVNLLGVLIAIKASKSTSSGSKGRLSIIKTLSHCEHSSVSDSAVQERHRYVPHFSQCHPSTRSLNVIIFLRGIFRGATIPTCVCSHRSQVLETVDGLDTCSPSDIRCLGHHGRSLLFVVTLNEKKLVGISKKSK